MNDDDGIVNTLCILGLAVLAPVAFVLITCGVLAAITVLTSIIWMPIVGYIWLGLWGIPLGIIAALTLYVIID